MGLGSLFGDFLLLVGSVHSREQLAKQLDRSVSTLRRWELLGYIPKPINNGGSKYYEDVDLINRLAQAERVILQGNSLFFIMRDETVIWMKFQAKEEHID